MAMGQWHESSKGNEVIATDLYDRGFRQVGIDFLQADREVDNIVTNPRVKMIRTRLGQWQASSPEKTVPPCVLQIRNSVESGAFVPQGGSTMHPAMIVKSGLRNAKRKICTVTSISLSGRGKSLSHDLLCGPSCSNLGV